MANTFVLPKSTRTFGLARNDWNQSFQATYNNFYGLHEPTSVNITIEGVSTTPPNGLVFRSSNTGVLYIKDTNEKGNPVHSGFTVNGIGSKIVETLGDYDTNDFELGELFKTVGSNARLYMKSSNVGTIVDLGLPSSNTVTNDMLSTSINLGSIT